MWADSVGKAESQNHKAAVMQGPYRPNNVIVSPVAREGQHAER